LSCACGKDTCGCGDGPKVIQLADENGQVHPFYIADVLYHKEQKYVFLVGLENDEQYALLKALTDETGREVFVNITDEAEWAELQRNL
jgi:uncharacterized protein YrzB (UPF0473 family)